MASLFVKEGPRKGDVCPLQGRRVWLGRDCSNDVSFDDRTVSRQHAVFVRREAGWYVQDLESQNLTLVNGEKVLTAPLSDGDEVQCGNVVLTFVAEGAPEPQLPGGPQEMRSAEVTQVIQLREAEAGGRAPARQQKSGDLRLSHLIRLSEAAATVKNVPALLEAMVQSLQIAMPADLVLPFVLDDDGLLRPFLAQRHGFVDSATGLGIDRALLKRCLEDGAIAASDDRGQGTSMACAPIGAGSKNLGLIYCERRDAPEPFTDNDLRYLVSVGLGAGLAMARLQAYNRMARRTRSLSRQLEEQYNMVGESEAMRQVFGTIRKVAPTEAGVLICGESGTGKEIVARALHRNSRRSDGPMEIVNCAAVPDTLMESELFGHVEGAFTGAVNDKPGRFELADGGTLFLDEVAELSLDCQAKLLRVLEEGRIRRVGDTKDEPVDVRIVAATNRDLKEAEQQGELRSDLFYRLDRLRINLPPLREREGDIALLARHYLEEFGRQVKHPVRDFAAGALDVFRAYRWPGNVRELRNVVERMVILADSPVLDAELIPDDLRAAARDAAEETPDSLEEVERRHIARVLEATGGNKKRAAEILGIDRSTLYSKLERHEIEG